jgi:site-specific DNA-adenine methylase
MIVLYTFTTKEQELIRELKTMKNSYNYSSIYDDFRKKYTNELSDFIKEGLLYHSNPDSEYDYVRYTVSERGHRAFESVNHLA